MKHVQKISVAKADSGAESIFFQLYFTVIAFMLSAAMGEKG